MLLCLTLLLGATATEARDCAQVELDASLPAGTPASIPCKQATHPRLFSQCAQREAELAVKREKMKERMDQFQKYIQENDLKRQRALRREKEEAGIRKQKEAEFDAFQAEMREARDVRCHCPGRAAFTPPTGLDDQRQLSLSRITFVLLFSPGGRGAQQITPHGREAPGVRRQSLRRVRIRARKFPRNLRCDEALRDARLRQ